MAASLKLSYGLRGDLLLSATQVAEGLACNCVCPGCGTRLVARQPTNAKAAYFAHYRARECPTGLAAALYLAAQRVLTQQQVFCLPGATGLVGLEAQGFNQAEFFADFDFDATPYRADVELNLFPQDEYRFFSRCVTIKRVEEESRTSTDMPDLRLETEAGPIILVLTTTPGLAEGKLAAIQKLDISTVEVNLSNVGRNLTDEQFTKLLVYQTDRKRWVHNAPLATKIAARHAQYLAEARALIVAYHAEALRKCS